MKNPHSLYVSLFATLTILVWVPSVTGAQPEGPPAVGGPLVREGDFAVRLLSALDLGSTDDEVEAETQLGAIGILPRNGWIADYPVTPDIVGELQKSVGNAANSQTISLGRDEALKRFIMVTDEFGLTVSPYTGAKPLVPESSVEDYANPEEINDYYVDEGAPVYTYYTPPPDYYYLYAWVPYPFWCRGFWFPGFFILHDFHRHFVVRNRVRFVSNHFNDVKHNKVFRVDPVVRFNGKTYAGIGAPRSKNFISTGVPKSDREVFNAPRARMAPGMVSPPWGSQEAVNPPWGSRGKITPAPQKSREMVKQPSQGRESVRPQPRGEKPTVPPSHGESMVSPQSQGDGRMNPPPHGGEGMGRGR